MDDLVVIKSYLQRHEAEQARGLLEGHGIQAVISPDESGAYRPHLIQLKVRKVDAKRSVEVLSTLSS